MRRILGRKSPGMWLLFLSPKEDEDNFSQHSLSQPLLTCVQREQSVSYIPEERGTRRGQDTGPE